MKSNLILILIITLFLCGGCTRTEETFYQDGKKSSEITYKNGIPSGESKFWHPNGVLMQQNTYIEGRVTGMLTRWHPNGNLESEEEYSHDLRNGVSRKYNNNGKLILETYYINDTLNGDHREYYPDGNIMIQGSHKDGLFQGEWKWYDADGFLLGEAIFEGGTGIQKAWRRDGTLLREIQYFKNLKHGSELHFDKEGNISKTIQYDQNSVIEIDDSK